MSEVNEINVKIPKKVVINKYAGNSGGWIYCLGFVGAFMYYVQLSATFGEGVIGFLKALVWPGYLVYHVFKYLGL